jgi:hypothetical protein
MPFILHEIATPFFGILGKPTTISTRVEAFAFVAFKHGFFG